MKEIHPKVGLLKLCELFGKTRQAYYDRTWREEENLMEELILIEEVLKIRKLLPRVGGIKLLNMLKIIIEEHRIKIGRDAFFELLSNYNLLIRPKKRYVRTTNSNHIFHKWSNLIEGFIPSSPEQLWVSDITYLETLEGFIYLFLITDAYSKMIMGFHLSHRLAAKGCLIALDKAVNQRQYTSTQLIHHSDRGIQYCCNQYVEALQENKISISMTQNGSPYENAIAERINGILKTEFNLNRKFKNYYDAIEPVASSIYAYNQIRPHLSIGLLTPEVAHQTEGIKIKKWKSKKWEARIDSDS
jgi:transposase InsO family protein